MQKWTTFSIVGMFILFVAIACNVANAQSNGINRDSLTIQKLKTELVSIEKQIVEITRLGGANLNDPNSLASQRFTELREKQTSIERRIRMLSYKGIQTDSLMNMAEIYQREKERVNRESQSLRKLYISRSESFINQWRHSDLSSRLQIPDDLVAQILLRLGELYAFEAIDDYGEAMERWNNNTTVPEPKVNYNKAAMTFAEVVRDFPSSQWAPDALYSLAYIKTEQADSDPFVHDPLRDEARTLYIQLLEYYPKSRYVDDAYFALGDYWFHTPPKITKPAQQLDSSAHYYNLIVQKGEKRKLGAALYMMGWTEFRRNTDDSYARAVDYFERTIYFYSDNPEIAEKSRRDDREEATKYIAGIFVDQGKVWSGSGAQNAVKYVEADTMRASRFGTKMLEILGQQLSTTQNAYDSAIYAWHGAIRNAPLHERAPFIQKNIIDMSRFELNNIEQWYIEGVKLYDNYNVMSEWWNANPNPKIRKQVRNMVRIVQDEVVRYAVARSIDNSRRDYNPAMMSEAVTRAMQLINEHPGDSSAYEWNFQVANMLASSQLNRLNEAYVQYQKVAEQYPFAWYKQESNLQMLLLSNERASVQLKDHPYMEAQVDSATGLPNAVEDELTEGEKLLVSAADKYATAYPQDDTIASTYLYKAGLTLYRRGEVDSSATFFNRIIRNYPRSKAYETSFQLYVNTFLIKRDFNGVERATQEMIAAPVSDSLIVFARERKAAAAFFNAAGLQENAEKILSDTTMTSKEDAYRIYEEAGDNYIKVAVETDPKFFKDGDLALENAALSYRKAQKPEKVIRAYDLLADRFPQSNRVPRALYNSGLILQNELKNNAAAAQKFEQLVVKYPQGEYDAKQALINASFNYEEAKDFTSAIRINQDFAKKYPNEPEANQLLFKTAGLYLKMGDVNGANKIYEEFARQYPNSPNTVVAHYERGKYADDRNDKVTARKEYQSAVQRHNLLVSAGGAGNPEYASKSLYRVTLWDLDLYRSIQFNAVKQVKEGVQQRDQKKALREVLFNNIRNIIQLSQMEQYEALFWAGELDENFGTTHLNQRVEPAKDAITTYDNRELVIEEAIAFYNLSVKEYANSLSQYDESIQLLEQQYEEQSALRHTLLTQIEEMTQSNAPGLTDSNTVLELRTKLIDKIASALNEAKRWKIAASEKAPELAYRTAMLKKDILVGATTLPDVPNPKIKDIDIGRTLYRQQVLDGVISAFTKNLFESFMSAIKVARESGYEEKWAQPSRREMESALILVLDEATKLNERWFHIFNRYHQDIQALLPRGEGARDRNRKEIVTLAAEMEQVVVLYSGDKGVTTVVNKIINELIEVLNTNEAEFNAMQPVMERVINWYLIESEKTIQYANLARNAELDSRHRFTTTNQYQYEDAYLKYESVRLSFEGQQKDLLISGYDFSERYKFPSPTVKTIVTKLSEIDPETYGAQVGLILQDNIATTDENWIAVDKYVEGFTDPNLDLDGWRFAEVSEMNLTDSAKIELSNAKPIRFVSTPSGTKTWFRKAIWIPERVTSASVTFVAGQVVSVFANKEFMYSTPEDVTDWSIPVKIDVSPLIKAGYNVISFEVDDTLKTNFGLAAVFKYRTVPGYVTPVFPEPVNASTISKVKRGVDAPPPPPVEATPPVETQPEPVPVETAPVIEEQPVPVPVEATPPVETQPEPVPVETAPVIEEQPVPVPVEATPPVETQPEPVPVETAPVIEEQPVPVPVEVIPPVETQPEPIPVETAPVIEEQPIPVPVEVAPPVETQPEPVPVETAPVIEEQPVPVPVEVIPTVETQPDPVPVETAPVIEEQPIPVPVEVAPPVEIPSESTITEPPVEVPVEETPIELEEVPVDTTNAPPDTTQP